ncbi:MAG: MFS transporter [Gammaproteobacteria bacterium]|nr:MFS transporter [Gammaproteobacteria bacterium]
MSRHAKNSEPLTPVERKAITGLASIYGFRMLGLFLVLPVFALYAEKLDGATPLLIGLAVGMYGLTQAILQIPFGLLSDRIGRKPVILAGLLLFAIGSVIAALAEDIWLILIGRAVQGSGAIAAAVMALAADLTRDSKRTRAMATIGMTIGAAFAVSLMAGPYLDQLIGISGIFWMTAVFAVLGMLVIWLVVPTPEKQPVHREAQTVPEAFSRILQNTELLRLDWGIFSLHLILTAMFLSVPLLLRDLGLPQAEHSLLYLVVLGISVVIMVPFIILAEKKGKIKAVFSGGIAAIALASLLLFSAGTSWLLAAAFLTLFFTGFNLLESLLPSLVSKTAPVDAKGTAMGVYSTGQFLGGFLGGLIGGLVHQYLGYEWVFAACLVIALLWLMVALTMKHPGQYSSRVIDLEGLSEQKISGLSVKLQSLKGVVEAVVIPTEEVVYLKVDRKQFNENELEILLVGSN